LAQEKVDTERVELGKERHKVLKTSPEPVNGHAITRSNWRLVASRQKWADAAV
jgi:hypothetical protein